MGTLVIMMQICGISMLLLGFLHVFFPKRFAWREELARLSLLNRQIFIVHCMFIVVVLALMGMLSIFYAPDLLQQTPVNRAVLGGLCFFWGFRLFSQWFIYSSELWKGDRFNTIMHGLFSLLWSMYTIVYGVAWTVACGYGQV